MEDNKIKSLLMTLGDLEDIEMEDGIGLKLHTSHPVSNPCPDTNTELSLSVLSCLSSEVEPTLSVRLSTWKLTRPKAQNGKSSSPKQELDIKSGSVTQVSICMVDSKMRLQTSQPTLL